MSLNPPDRPVRGSATRFVRACLRQPVDRTPVWFLRQAGRYMREYMEVRRHHTLLEICKRPELAAEVTITAAEKLLDRCVFTHHSQIVFGPVWRFEIFLLEPWAE